MTPETRRAALGWTILAALAFAFAFVLGGVAMR